MIVLALIVGLSAALYFYLTRTFNYWRERGVKHDKPLPLFGNNAKNFLLLANPTDMATEAYRKYPGEKIVGFYNSSSPELVIRDPGLAKRILTTDSACFRRRGLFPKHFQIEPLQKNLFTADDDLWRLLRTRMTPAFSSGKLKAMFPLILERTERLQNLLQKTVDSKKPIDSKDLMGRFTTDVISAIGFGVDSDSLNNENAAFRLLANRIISLDFLRSFKITLKQMTPRIFGHLRVLEQEEREIVTMMNTIMGQRNYEPSGRADFMDLLLECKKKGAMIGESVVEVNPDGSPKNVSIELDEELMAAQIFVFFVAGFETSSSSTSYALHQLAHNPEAQEKAQEEVDRVLAKHDNRLTYDAISEMTYLRWCFDEGLRMFPSGGYLQRQCVRSYTIPDVGVTIDPGVVVKIPVEAYHNDPEIFPEPEEFRPERFDPEVLTAEQKLAYLPFGNGPRVCVGERLGLMQSLASMAAVLARFSLFPAPGAPRAPRSSPRSNVIQTISEGLPLIFQLRAK